MGNTRTGTTKSRLPREMELPLVKRGAALSGDDPAARKAAMDKFLLNPERYEKLGQTIEGQALNPYDVTQDPAYKNLTASIGDESMRQTNNAMAQIRSRAAASGHTDTGSSGRLQRLQAQEGASAASQVAATIAPQAFGAQQAGQGRQLMSQSALASYEQTPSDFLEKMANMFKQQTTTTPKPNYLAQGLGK